jgi:signal peptidase I
MQIIKFNPLLRKKKMAESNFNKKVKLNSAHNFEGIDSSSLGVHNFPPGTIVFHPNEIQEIETEMIAIQTLQDNKVIVLDEFIQDSEKREPQQYLKSKVIETFREISKIFIIALFVFFLSRQIIQNYVVDGVSMEPTLFSNDYLIVNRINYRSLNTSWIPFINKERVEIRNALQVGDMIVFTQGKNRKRDLVKRIAAMPGQVVQMKDGFITVDGKTIQEYDTKAPTLLSLPPFFIEKTMVPEGKIFVLGDNKYASNDSRYLGFIDMHKIIGKAQLIYWPQDRWQSFEHQARIDLGK